MNTPRLGTSHSQRAFIPMHELEHSAPEVVEHPLPSRAGHNTAAPIEKAGYPSPVPTYVQPYQDQQQRHSYWSPNDFEVVPPQYSAQHPGLLAIDPATLVVPPIDHRAKKRGTICGIRRNLFLLLLGLAGLVLLAIAVGVGVGVGIGGNRSSGEAETAPVLAPSPTQASNQAPTSAPVSAPTPAPGGDSCPGISSTRFSASNGKKFLHLCALDYTGIDKKEATDIGSVRTGTFAECMEACSRRDDCQGAGWGPPNGSNKARGTCYMKKDLKTSHTATPDWNFAVLLDNL